jgi:transposase
VQREGLDAYVRIGEETTEQIERRQASAVVVRVVKPKFKRKQPTETERAEEKTEILVADSPDLPIPGGIAGPGMLADTIVRRWQDHLPLNRLEGIYAREGLDFAKSTICGWHAKLAELAKPIVDAMHGDALKQPYLCTDATGVLVRAPEKCRRGYFWVLVAPELHVLYKYSASHNSKAVDRNLANYEGYLVADAHSVYDHLYEAEKIIEAGCFAHARRYFFKSLESDPERARNALGMINALFRIERENESCTRGQLEKIRQRKSRPIAERFFHWCDAEAPNVLDETPISKAIGYARNQRTALSRFLDDGRLPLSNNISERNLSRQVLGRNYAECPVMRSAADETPWFRSFCVPRFA